MSVDIVCREEQRLTFRGQQSEDSSDSRQEAHVQHAIGFIKYQHFDLRKIDRAALRLDRASGRAWQSRRSRRVAAH